MAAGDMAPSWGPNNTGQGSFGSGDGGGFAPPTDGGVWGHQPLPPTFQQPGPGGAAPSWGPPSASNPNPGQAAPQPGAVYPGGPGQGTWPGQTTQLRTVDPNGPPQLTPNPQNPSNPLQPPPYAGYGVGPPAYGPVSSDPLHPNPSNISGLAPANIQQFGGTPQVNPTYANAAQQNYLTGNAAQQNYLTGNATTIDPANAQSYLNQAEMTTMGALNPLFQQQQQQLAQSLAARGITNSGSAQQLQNDLLSQQAGQYASAISPMISQGFGYAQQDVTGNAAAQNQFGLANLGYGNAALGTNAGYQQQANLANQQASNEADILNANYYATDRNANATAYNNYMNELLGLGSGQLNAIESAYLNSFGPSTGVESAYGNALSGQQSIYGSVFNNAMGNQQQQLAQAAMLFGAG